MRLLLGRGFATTRGSLPPPAPRADVLTERGSGGGGLPVRTCVARHPPGGAGLYAAALGYRNEHKGTLEHSSIINL